MQKLPTHKVEKIWWGFLIFLFIYFCSLLKSFFAYHLLFFFSGLCGSLQMKRFRQHRWSRKRINTKWAAHFAIFICLIVFLSVKSAKSISFSRLSAIHKITFANVTRLWYVATNRKKRILCGWRKRGLLRNKSYDAQVSCCKWFPYLKARRFCLKVPSRKYCPPHWSKSIKPNNKDLRFKPASLILYLYQNGGIFCSFFFIWITYIGSVLWIGQQTYLPSPCLLMVCAASSARRGGASRPTSSRRTSPSWPGCQGRWRWTARRGGTGAWQVSIRDIYLPVENGGPTAVKVVVGVGGGAGLVFCTTVGLYGFSIRGGILVVCCSHLF